MDAAEEGEESRSGEVYHGGNLAAAALRFPAAPRPWLDLSTGINPVAYPVPDLSTEAWTRLPERGTIRSLEAAAALAYGAADPWTVVAAPGAQALIQWLPHLVPARRVGILDFTYAEHAARWRAVGAHVEIVGTMESLEVFDVAIVVNPNNPDGRLVPPEALAAIAGNLARRGGLLILDEAFMDVQPLSHSLVPILPPKGVLVLRSFGKLYGLAGLRLGFAVASPPLAAAMRDALGPWAVSGPAIEIGGRALADAGWRAQTVARLRRDAARLDALLIGAGFAIEGGTPLFRLARHAGASGWFARLAGAGILARPFPDRSDWLRFGLPGDEGEWRRLAAALAR